MLGNLEEIVIYENIHWEDDDNNSNWCNKVHHLEDALSLQVKLPIRNVVCKHKQHSNNKDVLATTKMFWQRH